MNASASKSTVATSIARALPSAVTLACMAWPVSQAFAQSPYPNNGNYPAAYCATQNYSCHADSTNDRLARATVAVLVMTPSGQSACTGTLVNNRAGRLFVLTAKHCQSDERGNSGLTDAPLLSFVWNEQTSCDAANPGLVSPLSRTIVTMGATHIAEWQDTWLVELDSPPPAAARAYMLGYDATDPLPEFVQIVHHAKRNSKQFTLRQREPLPLFAGEPERGMYDRMKKVDLGTDPLDPSYTSGNVSTYSIYNTGIGQSDRGASGAAFADLNQRLIGVHTGGAGCEAFSAHRFASAWSRTYNTFFPDQVLDGREAPLPVAPSPTVSLTVPATAANNATIAISWSSTDATSCVASGTWTGTRAPSGSTTVTVTNPNPAGGGAVDRNFTLTCTGAGGEAATTRTVSVAAAPPSGGASDGTSGGGSASSGGGAMGVLTLMLGALTALRRRRRC